MNSPVFSSFSLMHSFRSPFIVRAFVLLYACMSTLLSASPLPEDQGRWVNPCGGSRVSSVFLPQLLSGSQMTTATWETLDDLLILQQQARDQAIVFKLEVANRLGNADVVNSLDQYHLDGFPEIENFVYGSNADLGQIFKADYDRFTRLAIFIDKTKADFIQYEAGADVESLTILENHVINILCQLDSAAKSSGVTVSTALSRDNVLPPDFSEVTSRADRDMRDYIMIRDTVMFLNSVIGEYKPLSDVLKANS